MSSDDIKIHDPASREKEKQQYPERDLENVLEGHQFQNWDQFLNYLREEGDKARGVTPGELKQMVEDFSRAKERGKPFTNDPHQLYELAHSS
jgi:hypothetical protein